MKTFFEPVVEIAGMEQLEQDFREPGRAVLMTGCIDTQKVHLAEAVGQPYPLKLIVTADEAKAREIQEDCRFFGGESLYYPAKDFIFYSADVHGNQIVGQRLRCISRILNAISGTKTGTGSQEGSGLTVVTTMDACADFLVAPEQYLRSSIEISKASRIDPEELAVRLVRIGYERTGMVEGPGQFAIRGGIIDLYSYTWDAPARVELWDEEVDSIRYFDAESQRSIEQVDSLLVFPATECLLTEEEEQTGMEAVHRQVKKQLKALGFDRKKKTKEEYEACNRVRQLEADLERTRDYSRFLLLFAEKTCGFVEYFPAETSLLILDEPERLKERMELVEYEYQESMKNRLAGGYAIPGQAGMLQSLHAVYHTMLDRRLLLLTMLDSRPSGLPVADTVRVEARGISSYNNSFEYLADDLKKYQRNQYRSILVCNSRTRAARIVEDLKTFDLNVYFSEDFEEPVVRGTVMVTYGNIHRGFEYPLLGFVVIAENDIFTAKRRKKQQKQKIDGRGIASFNELNIGDYVVHENHGLGIYRGIEKITVEGVEKDYIKIEYGGNSNLYVLATQLDRLQKYAAADTEKKPKINKLGTQEWNRTRAKVHGAVEEVAKDLVRLYAARQQEHGYTYGPDTEWQKEFEEMFPYEETADQLTAIADTKRDMESGRIMDRLICGDVGYGKTEVAIRAAFKAVQEGKQVAYLVPTTVLAQQHYHTFAQRMHNFPVTVAELSSFRTANERKDTIQRLKKGLVDVVIGTHRLLSKDIQFKDLGLLIVDEEQRFGVAHKEKIKKLKENVDVLTLSATPIPRTLHMSLVGIRDMSVLEEPPVDRLPIQTFVTEHNDEMIREAITRELARNGQVYYVYNRVRTIDEMTAHLQELVPDANIAFAHGQMEKRQLEKIMMEFINGDIDVLVSTTIIETGMDISNVNTMIIEDADKFGLSQLYQLRGRVGRSNRTAYAFLLYRRDRMLSEVAEKRLSAIREFSDLGSGFKIAMKDLEIRGAGNVLGKSQHGHMAAVGYDLYCKMLNEAVNDLKGITNEYSFETSVDLSVDAYIPASYIKSEYQKLDIYKRIATIETEEELSDMQDELTDRYGTLPECARQLLHIALIKAHAHKIGIMEMKGGLQQKSWQTRMIVYPKARLQADAIPDFIDCYGGSMQLETTPDPEFIWKVTNRKFSNAGEYLQGLEDMLAVMESMLLTEPQKN